MKKAILFDCDGVLINSERYYLQGTLDWLAQYGFNVNVEDIVKIVGTTYDVTCQMLADITGFSSGKCRQINDDYFRSHPLPFKDLVKPGVIELMQYAKQQHIKMAICSSSSHELVQQVVKDCGFSDYIHYFISGETIERSKPDPQIYNLAVQELNVNKEDCIIIEDSTIGIQAAYSANIFTIAILDEMIPQDTSKANVTITNMNQVKNYLK